MRWVALCVVLLSGCRGVPWRPEAFDEAARVEALGLRFEPNGSGVLTLRLAVRNPASGTATLVGVDFDLAVDGRQLAVGLQQVEVPLGMGGWHTVELTFPLVSQRATGTASRILRQVRLSGGALLRYGASTERRAPFRAQQEMRLPWVPLAE